jgi:hypothetical protein
VGAPAILRCVRHHGKFADISIAELNLMKLRLFLVLLGLAAATPASPASFYTQRFDDPKAV